MRLGGMAGKSIVRQAGKATRRLEPRASLLWKRGANSKLGIPEDDFILTRTSRIRAARFSKRSLFLIQCCSSYLERDLKSEDKIECSCHYLNPQKKNTNFHPGTTQTPTFCENSEPGGSGKKKNGHGYRTWGWSGTCSIPLKGCKTYFQEGN